MKQIRDKKAAFFSIRLRKRIHGLKKIILFGSHARGDAHEGSDYDFAVILDKKDSRALNAVRSAEVEFLDKFDTLSSSIVFNKSEWKRHKDLPIGRNIIREGINL